MAIGTVMRRGGRYLRKFDRATRGAVGGAAMIVGGGAAGVMLGKSEWRKKRRAKKRGYTPEHVEIRGKRYPRDQVVFLKSKKTGKVFPVLKANLRGGYSRQNRLVGKGGRGY